MDNGFGLMQCGFLSRLERLGVAPCLPWIARFTFFSGQLLMHIPFSAALMRHTRQLPRFSSVAQRTPAWMQVKSTPWTPAVQRCIADETGG
jgi:hypothetical protein